MQIVRPLVFLATAWLASTLAAQALPPEVEAALARAKVPKDALTVMAVDVQGAVAPRLSHRATVPVNPASVMKLVTTSAALDLLGPAFNWSTPVYVDGLIKDGQLQGNLYLQGQGDPKLVVERLWLLLRRVRGLGIKHITGDIVLDHSAFEVQVQDPAEFDGEPLRPYNAAPDALLLNFKAVTMTFVPDLAANVARVQYEPGLAGVQYQATVPLKPGECGDYRGALKPDFTDLNAIKFSGNYAVGCAEKQWSVAYVDPASYSVRMVDALWRDVGGTLGGHVRDGKLPKGLVAVLDSPSPPLAELVRDINKYSNNVMARQLFLTLGLRDAALSDGSAANLPRSRQVVQNWWRERVDAGSPADAPVLDNGSGLSRRERVSAQALARLLQVDFRAAWMPELMSSLPIVGVDGTLRKSKAKLLGGAHLKTGSLRDVAAIAGYVDGASGRRYVLVAIVNHANAAAARPAFDALIDWVAKDQ